MLVTPSSRSLPKEFVQPALFIHKDLKPGTGSFLCSLSTLLVTGREGLYNINDIKNLHDRNCTDSGLHVLSLATCGNTLYFPQSV